MSSRRTTPRDLVKLIAARRPTPQVQFTVNGLRTRFQAQDPDLAEDRKEFVYLLARFVKSFHFLTCFFTYPDEIKEFAAFAEYVGPAAHQAGQCLRADETNPSDGSREGGGRVSRRSAKAAATVKLQARQGQQRRGTAAEEGLCAGHDCRDSDEVRDHATRKPCTSKK